MSHATSSHERPDPEEANGEEGSAPGISSADAASDKGSPAGDTPAGGVAEAADGHPDADTVGNDSAGGGGRDEHPAGARAVARTVTILAGVLVFAALSLPNKVTLLGPAAFVRIPAEALLLGALMLVLPRRARRVVGVLAGVGIALLTVLKVVDMAFYSTLGTPFDLLFDWGLIPDGLSAFSDSVGHTTAIIALVAVAILVVGLFVLMPLAVIRLGGVMGRHTRATTGTLLTLAVVWIASSVFVTYVPGTPPLATRNTAALAYQNAQQVRSDLKDQEEFAKAASRDSFASVPPGNLLTALRGKNVIFTFVESYGRCAVQDPVIAPGVNAMLTEQTARLKAAGYSSESAFLTSATYGGSSWLGHSTFLSGLWINNQSRYRTIVNSDHMALTAFFKRTGAWRTVGIVPGTKKTWPEGSQWEGLDHIYGDDKLGYKGPNFGWSTMPDQYTLEAYQRLENGQPHDKPLMTEIVLTSSHEPWAPIPTTVPWNQVGNGSVYVPIKKAGKHVKKVWKSSSQVRAQYGLSIQYSISNLVDFLLKYESKNTVLVFLGDHQPASIVSGNHASHDVPVSIVAHDPALMKRISGWGWQDGLRPDPRTAPVWRMSSFRNSFLTAFGPQPGPAPSKPTR